MLGCDPPGIPVSTAINGFLHGNALGALTIHVALGDGCSTLLASAFLPGSFEFH
jgi:hypothetical protein